MGLSLRDQLQKQGLVSKKQVKQAEKEAGRSAMNASKKRRKGVSTVPVEGRQESISALAAESFRYKVEQDKKLNLEREEAKQQKLLLEQIDKLVEHHQQNDPSAIIPFSFALNGPIKTLRVSKLQQLALARGLQVIIAWKGTYRLLLNEIAEKIIKLDPTLPIYRNLPVKKEQDDACAEYNEAQFQIPDDIMW